MEMRGLPQVTSSFKVRERMPIELGGLLGPRELLESSQPSLHTFTFFIAGNDELLYCGQLILKISITGTSVAHSDILYSSILASTIFLLLFVHFLSLYAWNPAPCQCLVIQFLCSSYPLGTVRPIYRTGVSLLSRERFLFNQ